MSIISEAVSKITSSVCGPDYLFARFESMSIGRGKIIVEFFSTAMVFSVCKYLS